MTWRYQRTRTYVDMMMRDLLNQLSLAKAGGQRATLEDVLTGAAPPPGGAAEPEAAPAVGVGEGKPTPPPNPGQQMTLDEETG